MKKHNHRATGCLWCVLEFTACVVFIVFLILKLCGNPMSWITVFSPLIVGVVLTAMVLFLLVAQALMDKGDK